jgi:prefoldin subunit 5
MRPIRRPNTDRAISGFTKALAELEAVEAAEQAKLDKIASKIDALRDQQDTAATAKDRAARLRAKFANFLSA